MAFAVPGGGWELRRRIEMTISGSNAFIFFGATGDVTLAAGTDISFSENIARRFEAYGWHTVPVADGNDLVAIDAALRAPRAEAPGREPV